MNPLIRQAKIKHLKSEGAKAHKDGIQLHNGPVGYTKTELGHWMTGWLQSKSAEINENQQTA